jgi:DNA-binding LytR/AlgR family response regulator
MEQPLPYNSEKRAGEIFTVLLVEDNFLNRRMVKNILKRDYVVKEATDTQQADELLQAGVIHLAIIDINLGIDKEDGIGLGQRVKEIYDIPFIYLTAYATTDISGRAISTQPSSYLTKPFKEVDLVLSIELALQRYNTLKPAHKKFILAKEGDYFVKLLTESIDYFEASGNYLFAVAGNKKYKCRSTVKEMLSNLPDGSFVQTHRAFIVNKSKIDKFSTEQVVLGDRTIPVSATYASNLFV